MLRATMNAIFAKMEKKEEENPNKDHWASCLLTLPCGISDAEDELPLGSKAPGLPRGGKPRYFKGPDGNMYHFKIGNPDTQMDEGKGEGLSTVAQQLPEGRKTVREPVSDTSALPSKVDIDALAVQTSF